MSRLLSFGLAAFLFTGSAFAEEDIRELQLQYLELRDINYDFVENYRQYVKQREEGTLSRQKAVEFKQKHRQFLVRLPEVRNSAGATFESDIITPAEASDIDPLNNTNAWFHKKFGVNPLERESINDFFRDKPFIAGNQGRAVFTSLAEDKRPVQLNLTSQNNGYSAFSPMSADAAYADSSFTAAPAMGSPDMALDPELSDINNDVKDLDESYAEMERLKFEAIEDIEVAEVEAIADMEAAEMEEDPSSFSGTPSTLSRAPASSAVLDKSGSPSAAPPRNEVLIRVNNNQITKLNRKTDVLEERIENISRQIGNFEKALADKAPPMQLIRMREFIKKRIAGLHHFDGVLKVGNNLVNDLQVIIGEPSPRVAALNDRQSRVARALFAQSDRFHRSAQELGNPFRFIENDQLSGIFGELDPGNGNPELPVPGTPPVFPGPPPVDPSRPVGPPPPPVDPSRPVGPPPPPVDPSTPVGPPPPPVDPSTPVGPPPPTVDPSTPVGPPPPTVDPSTPVGPPPPTVDPSTPVGPPPVAPPDPDPVDPAIEPPPVSTARPDPIAKPEPAPVAPAVEPPSSSAPPVSADVEPAPPLSSKIAPEPDTEETDSTEPSSGTPTTTPAPEPEPEPDAEEASPALDETPPITTALAPKNDDKDEDASSKKKDSCLDDWYPFKCTAKMLGF